MSSCPCINSLFYSFVLVGITHEELIHCCLPRCSIRKYSKIPSIKSWRTFLSAHLFGKLAPFDITRIIIPISHSRIIHWTPCLIVSFFFHLLAFSGFSHSAGRHLLCIQTEFGCSIQHCFLQC